MLNFKTSFLTVTAGPLLFISCNPVEIVDPTIPNQEEVITTQPNVLRSWGNIVT